LKHQYLGAIEQQSFDAIEIADNKQTRAKCAEVEIVQLQQIFY